MKVETTSAAIEGFVGMNPKMYSFLVDNNSNIKNQKVRIEMMQQQVTMNAEKYCGIINV